MTPEDAAVTSLHFVSRLADEIRRSAERYPGVYAELSLRQSTQWAGVRGWLEAIVERGGSDAELAAATRAILTAVDDPANDLMHPLRSSGND